MVTLFHLGRSYACYIFGRVGKGEGEGEGGGKGDHSMTGERWMRYSTRPKKVGKSAFLTKSYTFHTTITFALLPRK